MIKKSFTEYYHQETKYSPEGLEKNKKQVEWNKQPVPFKDYKLGEKVELAGFLNLEKEKESKEKTPEEENLDRLANLLYQTNGITAIVPYMPPLLLRAAPSAGGLYPTEVYVFTNNFTGIRDGIYNFNVRQHSLVGFWPKNEWEKLKNICFSHPSFADAQIAIVFSGVFERSAWRYHERAYRRILLDTGHVIGNLAICAPFSGFYANFVGGFKDEELNQLLWLDKNEEVGLAVITLTEKKNDYQVESSLPSETITPPFPKNNLIIDFHHSGNISSELKVKNLEKEQEEESSEKFSIAFAEKLPDLNLAWKKKIEDVIIDRRSTRAFTGEHLSKEELAKILSFAYKPSNYADQGFDPQPSFFALSLIETYIAVTNVKGLEDGCYFYRPEKNELKQIRFKNFQEELHFLCLGQELGRDAAAVVFHTVNLPEAVKKYGERAYRYLHLDAGNLGQRINLACMVADLGVSGIGGFFDDQVNELLGIPEQNAVLYITVIGRPFVNQF